MDEKKSLLICHPEKEIHQMDWTEKKERKKEATFTHSNERKKVKLTKEEKKKEFTNF